MNLRRLALSAALGIVGVVGLGAGPARAQQGFFPGEYYPPPRHEPYPHGGYPPRPYPYPSWGQNPHWYGGSGHGGWGGYGGHGGYGGGYGGHGGYGGEHGGYGGHRGR